MYSFDSTSPKPGGAMTRSLFILPRVTPLLNPCRAILTRSAIIMIVISHLMNRAPGHEPILCLSHLAINGGVHSHDFCTHFPGRLGPFMIDAGAIR